MKNIKTNRNTFLLFIFDNSYIVSTVGHPQEKNVFLKKKQSDFQEVLDAF